MVNSIDKVLEETLQKLELNNKIKEKKVLNMWSEVIGEKLKKHTKANYINKGILFIKVNNSTWAHQLLFLKKDLISRLNSKLGQDIVNDIRFKIGSISDKDNSTKEESFNLNEINLTSGEVERIQENCDQISDPELSQKIQSLMIKNKKLSKLKKEKGWVKCEYCSALHPAEADNCIICEINDKKNLNKLEQLLLETPWLNYEEVSDIYPELLSSDYSKIKQKLIDKFWAEIKEKVPTIIEQKTDKKSIQEFKVLIQYYVMLQENIYPKELNRDIIKEVIGENYIQVYDKL